MFTENVFLILFVTYTFGEVIINQNTGDNLDVCTDATPCIKKCCPENYLVENDNCILSTTVSHSFEFKVYNSTEEIKGTVNFNVLHDMECSGKNRILSHDIEEDKYYIQPNGNLFKPLDTVTSSVNFLEYCLDTFVTQEGEVFTAMVCDTEEESPPVMSAAMPETFGDVILNHNTGDNRIVCTKRTPCIKKCCPENYIYENKTCVYSPTDKFEFKAVTDITNHTVKFNVLHDKECPTSDNLRLNSEYEEDLFFIHENGTLLKPLDDLVPRVSYQHYCLDIFGNFNQRELSVLVCYNKGDLESTDSVATNSMGMIISMPFLLITFLVYLVLPESNLHRKALMSYVFALLVAYISLVTIQMYVGQMPNLSCHLLAYLTIFFFLVSFFWMNVMCVDMWLAFSGMRTVISKRSAETKRFIFYCIYAWGVPVIHVGIVLMLNHFAPIDSSYSPQIGDRRCFLGSGMPTFYYFYLPMAILIGINVVLFVMTTIRIQQIQKETSMLKQTESKKSYEDDKQKFNLYLKLMFAMGVNWIMELVSWTVNQLVAETPPFVWYLTDFTNAMYGVLIFVIFVFKKKVWQMLKKRYYIFIGKPHLAHTLTTSSTRGTRTSNYSTTDTAVSTDYRLSDMKKNQEESALTRT